ncbi:MAG: PIN domain-containing protein [Epsilonproteobacteria bacterium]|nr:PIN domain-containing protein [Campylobacterota bacterium]
MKIFLDTNIFLDLILKREGYQESLIILNAIEKEIFDGVILDITILNIDYIANKQVKDLKTFLLLLSTLFEIKGASNEMIKDAIAINNPDLEDNLQYICAKITKCEVIVSNDKNFYKGNLEVFSSVDFIEKYL